MILKRYTASPQEKLKASMHWIISEAFRQAKNNDGSQYLRVSENEAKWTNDGYAGNDDLIINVHKCKEMLDFLLDNMYVQCGDKTFKQVVGIPMGTDCGPFLANLYLHHLEYRWLRNIFRDENPEKIDFTRKYFSHCFRYIDDLIALNNDGSFDAIIKEIYPEELLLERQNSGDQSAEYLDMIINIENGYFVTEGYDKRDGFDFLIVKYPHAPANTEYRGAHNVITSQCIRFGMISTHFDNFAKKVGGAISTMKGNGLNEKLLLQNVRKACERYPKITSSKFNRSIEDIVKGCQQRSYPGNKAI